MDYLIIFIIVAMVIAPVMWIMPSPSQKRLVSLRHKALALGFQVKICDLPQTRRMRVRGEAVVHGVCYRVAWFARGKSNNHFEYILLRDADEEQTIQNPQLKLLLEKTLQALPQDIVAIEFSNIGLAIYWTERVEIEQLENIYQQLTSLKDTIAKSLTEYSV